MIIVEAAETGFRAVLTSTVEEIDEAESRTCVMLEKYAGLVDPFAVRLLMREALLNAIRHGHKNESQKRIDYDFSLGRHTIRIQIQDEGDGFDWKTALSETLEPGWNTGRGMTILKAYADEVLFNSKGNQVTLVVHLKSDRS